MAAAVPEIGGRPWRVPGDRNHLEVVARHMPRGERSGRGVGPGHLWQVGVVAEQRRSESAQRVLSRDVGLMPVVQVVADGPAEVGDRQNLVRHLGGTVNEQVALLALQQEGPHMERLRERQRLGRGRIDAGKHGLHLESSSLVIFHQTASAAAGSRTQAR